MLTGEIIEERIRTYQDLGKEILSHSSELLDEMVQGGMTRGGAVFDLALFKKQLHTIENERDRLLNRNFAKGDLAASIPYDLPNFLMTMYTFPWFLTAKLATRNY